jgi:hypothetical protein
VECKASTGASVRLSVADVASCMARAQSLLSRDS